MFIPSPSFLSGTTSCCQYTYFFRGASSYLLLQISYELQEYLDCDCKMSENKLPKAQFKKNCQIHNYILIQFFRFSQTLALSVLQLREDSTIPNVLFVVWFPPSFSWLNSPIPDLGGGGSGVGREWRRQIYHVSTEF